MLDNKTKYRILSALRKIDQWSPAVRVVRDRTRLGPGVYLCEGCGLAICTRESGHTDEEVEYYQKFGLDVIDDKQAIDHINPVVDPEEGFIDWNTYFERLFVSAEERQSLCYFCHYFKTQTENSTRRGK